MARTADRLNEWVVWRKREESWVLCGLGLNTIWMVESSTKLENTWERVVFVIKIMSSVSDKSDRPILQPSGGT